MKPPSPVVETYALIALLGLLAVGPLSAQVAATSSSGLPPKAVEKGEIVELSPFTVNTTGDIGYVLGPLLLGLISDGFGPITALVAAAGLLVVAGAAFAIFAPETYRARSS